MNPLEDRTNLLLLRYLLSGDGVNVNVNHIAKKLGIHRATAKRKVEGLLARGLVNPPIFPFTRLFIEYPLLVLVWAEIPKSAQTLSFFKDDSHVFAAFSCMEGPYNTFLVEFFKDMESYHEWRDSLVRNMLLPPREHRAPADAFMLSNRMMFKNEPNCFVRRLQESWGRRGQAELDGHRLDATELAVLSMLVEGEGIRTNDTLLSRELGINRRSVERRVRTLVSAQVVSPPRCHFPNLLMPPGYNLIVSRVGVRAHKKEIMEYIMSDDNVPRALETITGRYHLLLFSAFNSIDDFFEWGEKLNTRFPNSISAIANTFLSSRAMHTVQQHKVSLSLIEARLARLAR